jgi:SAM-dependent methyltransferase
MNMPFSQACENNRGPILKVIKPLLADKHRVLEIGSGTGQHAAWFAQHMPHLIWQTSDVLENHWGIKQWIASNPSDNLPVPLELNIFQDNLPAADYDAIFTANTAHIMPWEGVERLFDCLAVQLPTQGIFCLYGPMGYNGLIAPESNIQFDQFLR